MKLRSWLVLGVVACLGALPVVACSSIPELSFGETAGDATVDRDGGGATDAPVTDAPATDAPRDVVVDTGPTCPAACSRCTGGACVITCPGGKCGGTITCPPGQPCVIDCSNPNSCDNKTVKCAAGQPCTVDCAANRSCSTMTLDANGGKLCVKCNGGNMACDTLTCQLSGGATCTRTCAAGGQACNDVCMANCTEAQTCP